MRSLLAALFIILSQIGCSSSSIVSSSPNDGELGYTTFNSEMKDKSATIVLKDASELDGREVSAGSDSITWNQTKSDARFAVATPTVNKIVTKNRTIGALEGAGIAFLVGAASGLLAAVIGYGDPQGMDGIAYVAFPVIGAGAGILTGSIIGAVSGHSYEYEFNPVP